MIVNDYKTVVDVSNITYQSTRNVRRIIDRIKDEVDSNLLFKDEEFGTWKIHKDLMYKFKPQRIRANKFYALNIDPCDSYSAKDLHKIMKEVIDMMGDTSTEINYTIEKKKKEPFLNHLHCFVKCNNKRKLIQNFRIAFSKVSYHQSAIFDLESWKGYITKENNEIKTLKN
jgi:hypothetical protein